MEPGTSAIDGAPSESTSTTFKFALCPHDEESPLIHGIWRSMREDGLFISDPEASPAATELSLTSLLPCPQCHTKEEQENRIKGWLQLPREDTPATRTELTWIGFALESLGSEARPHLTRWAYVVAERLGADVSLKLAACIRDASHPDGPLRRGVAARCLKDSIDEHEVRQRVRAVRHDREQLLALTWSEITAAAGDLVRQLDSGGDVGILNQAGEKYAHAIVLYAALAEGAVKMPEGLLNSSKAPRDEAMVHQDALDMRLQNDEVQRAVDIARRLPSETGLKMLLPFQEAPSPDDAHRMRTALKVLGDHLEDLRERLETFQQTIRGIEWVVEAESAGLPRLAWLLYESEVAPSRHGEAKKATAKI